MKIFGKYYIFFVVISLLTSCKKNNNLVIPSDIVVQNFVWKGLNSVYFWKDNVADLNEKKFKNQAQLNDFIRKFSSPDSELRAYCSIEIIPISGA